MRHNLSWSLALVLLLIMSGTARADENVKAVAGLKTWINNWKNAQAGSESMSSNTTALAGWEGEVEFSTHVFAGASYLMSAFDYKLDLSAGVSEVERTDFDLMVGYQLDRYAGVFTGYRSTQFLKKQGNVRSKETLHGPLIGIRGAAPLNTAFSLYSKFTYLPMSHKTTYSTADKKETATGWFAEAGVKYVFTSRTTGAIGYRYETTRGRNATFTDTFSGATLDVMVSF